MKIKIQHQKQRSSLAKPSVFSSMNNSMINIKKQQSKHTKLSSDVIATSVHNNAVTTKKFKQKKQQMQVDDRKQKSLRQSQLVTSGGSKQLREKIKNKKSCDFSLPNYFNQQKIDQGCESYRQYCLVEDSFIPVKSTNQHIKLQQIMRSTADTTNRYDDFSRGTFRNSFPFKLIGKSENELMRVKLQEQDLFRRGKKVSIRQVQINACQLYEEIGMQYSERLQLIKPIVEQIKEKILMEIDVQTDEFPPNQAPMSPVKLLDKDIDQPEQQHQPQKQQTLSQLLLKLQFKHLPNQKVFDNLSTAEKQHYSQLLNSLISKLNSSKIEKSMPTLNTKQEIEIQQLKQITTEKIKLKYLKLEMEVYKRESSQMNWIQKKVYNNQQGQVKFDTSIAAINSFLLNFFCFIQLNYLEDFFINIKKQYGPSYNAQFQRLIRKITLQSPTHNVLHKETFQEFSQQVIHSLTLQLSQLTPYQQTHLHAVFDYTNQLLNTYRPYYQHYGQPFPWSVKMYSNICQYVIDENSLEIIFGEVKENIEKTISMLCGLIVDQQFMKDIKEDNPLSVKRTQKENLMVEEWMNEKTEENREVQCEATIVLNEVSDEVYNLLLLEMLNQLRLYN